MCYDPEDADGGKAEVESQILVLLGDVGPSIILLLGEPGGVSVELLAVVVEGDDSLHRHLLIISHNTKIWDKKKEKGLCGYERIRNGN